MGDKRRHKRSKFTFPVQFDMFLRGIETKTFKAYISNMSVGGACIRFEDKYGRVDLNQLIGAVIKIRIDVPQGDNIHLRAMVHWGRKESPDKGFFNRIGVQLLGAEDWQIKQIDTFIKLRHKDQKMLWNLWDQHLQPR